jgi:hypothetical protein
LSALNGHGQAPCPCLRDLMLLMQLVFGPVITLAAAAIAYYFGANSRTGR